MKCKDCKHWKRNTDAYEHWDGYYGECESQKFQYENPNGYDNEKEVERDNLLYADYEGYSASFETGEEFGCIHYEAK